MIDTKIELDQLEGTWHIIYTNFPMWLKGDKTDPMISYMIENKNNVIGLRDQVDYQNNGKISSIIGFDKTLNNLNTKFEWRGKGIISLLTSNWEIIYMEDKLDWLIIHFEKTIFTPAGYDVLSKNKLPSENQLIDIQNKLRELNLLDQLTALRLSNHE